MRDAVRIGVTTLAVLGPAANADLTILSAVRELAGGGRITSDLATGGTEVVAERGLDGADRFINPIFGPAFGVDNRQAVETASAGVSSFRATAGYTSTVEPDQIFGTLTTTNQTVNRRSAGAAASTVLSTSISRHVVTATLGASLYGVNWSANGSTLGGTSNTNVFEVAYRRVGDSSFTVLGSGEGIGNEAVDIEVGGEFEFLFSILSRIESTVTGTSTVVSQSSASMSFEVFEIPAPAVSGVLAGLGLAAGRRRR